MCQVVGQSLCGFSRHRGHLSPGSVHHGYWRTALHSPVRSGCCHPSCTRNDGEETMDPALQKPTAQECSPNEKVLLENSLCHMEASCPQLSLWVGRLIFLSQRCPYKADKIKSGPKQRVVSAESCAGHAEEAENPYNTASNGYCPF